MITEDVTHPTRWVNILRVNWFPITVYNWDRRCMRGPLNCLINNRLQQFVTPLWVFKTNAMRNVNLHEHGAAAGGPKLDGQTGKLRTNQHILWTFALYDLRALTCSQNTNSWNPELKYLFVITVTNNITTVSTQKIVIVAAWSAVARSLTSDQLRTL